MNVTVVRSTDAGPWVGTALGMQLVELSCLHQGEWFLDTEGPLVLENGDGLPLCPAVCKGDVGRLLFLFVA